MKQFLLKLISGILVLFGLLFHDYYLLLIIGLGYLCYYLFKRVNRKEKCLLLSISFLIGLFAAFHSVFAAFILVIALGWTLCVGTDRYADSLLHDKM